MSRTKSLGKVVGQNSEKQKPINQDDVKLNKIKTLNNMLCMINSEIQTVKSINENGKKSKESNKRIAIENIQMLSASFKILNDGVL